MPREIKQEGQGAPGNGNYRAFLRNSHLFSSAVQEVVQERYLRRVTELPVTTSQLHLLQLMSNHGPQLVGEAAVFLGVSPAAASKSVDKLVRLDLIERLPQEGDRRAARLGITGEGERLVAAYEAEKVRSLAPILGGLSERELKTLNGLLERIAMSILDAETGEAGLCLKCGAYCSDSCAFQGRDGVCPYGQRKCR